MHRAPVKGEAPGHWSRRWGGVPAHGSPGAGGARGSVLTLCLSALFQRLRSQRGGHRQQDRAGNGEPQSCPCRPLLRTPPPPLGCSYLWGSPLPGWVLSPEGGSPLRSLLLGRAAPLSAAAAG